MRCLLLSDTPTRDLETLLAREEPECVITLGDLDYSFLEPLCDFTGIKLGVYGNHCCPGNFSRLGIINLHGRTGQIGGLSFLGIEGCLPYKPAGAIMHTEDEILALLSCAPTVDVVVTHCPPYGINDEPENLAHAGWRALRDYIETNPPRYVLHGHTYPKPNEVITQIGQTEIVYCYGSLIVDLRGRS